MSTFPPPFTRRLPLALRVKRLLPRSLFGRTLLIFVVPTFIMLAAATYVFFDRHWYTVTTRMTHALSGDIAAPVNGTLGARSRRAEILARGASVL